MHAPQATLGAPLSRDPLERDGGWSLVAEPHSAVAPLVIIGLGNEIAGDDAVGVHAARLLHKRLLGRTDIEVIELPWAGLHLLTALRGRRRAILIDSLQSQKHPPGTVLRLTEEDLAGSVRLNSFHDLNYPTAVALGRALGWAMPDRIDIIAVEGAEFDRFDTRLTPAVRQGLRQAVQLVMADIARLGPPGVGDQVEVDYASSGQP